VTVPEELISIGVMSRWSGLSVKALRYYDRIELLRPAAVDDVTGFRYYAPEQTPEARAIGRLRSMDVPIDEIRRYLGSRDRQAALDEVLLAHRTRLETRTTRIAGHLHDLMHLLHDGLETVMTEATSTEKLLTPEEERQLGVCYFNATWDLMEREDRTQEDDDLMLHMTHASALHWSRAAGATTENYVRSQWQASRVNAVLRRPEACLHHAQRCLDICLANGVGDWDVAFAYEALARAHAIAGDMEAARAMTERALEAVEQIAEDDDRKMVLGDLETIPGQERFW
jgi:DNA-binding transcriptional MerR regulator